MQPTDETLKNSADYYIDLIGPTINYFIAGDIWTKVILILLIGLGVFLVYRMIQLKIFFHYHSSDDIEENLKHSIDSFKFNKKLKIGYYRGKEDFIKDFLYQLKTSLRGLLGMIILFFMGLLIIYIVAQIIPLINKGY